MSARHYVYIKCREEEVQQILDSYTEPNVNWRVHTFNRAPNASVVDILLEREDDHT
jgi:hypothetical protein